MITFSEAVNNDKAREELVKKIASSFKGSSIGRNQSMYADVKFLDENHSTIIFTKDDRTPFNWNCNIVIAHSHGDFEVVGVAKTAVEAYKNATSKLKGALTVELSAWDNQIRKLKSRKSPDLDEFVEETETAKRTVDALLKIQ